MRLPARRISASVGCKNGHGCPSLLVYVPRGTRASFRVFAVRTSAAVSIAVPEVAAAAARLICQPQRRPRWLERQLNCPRVLASSLLHVAFVSGSASSRLAIETLENIVEVRWTWTWAQIGGREAMTTWARTPIDVARRRIDVRKAAPKHGGKQEASVQGPIGGQGTQPAHRSYVRCQSTGGKDPESGMPEHCSQHVNKVHQPLRKGAVSIHLVRRLV